MQKGSGTKKGCLWCFTAPDGLVAYTFTESWKAESIADTLTLIEGYVQCDDYKGYSSKVEVEGELRPLVLDAVRLGCWMHVRRRFFDALKLGDKRAQFAVELIRRIYRIESAAKHFGLSEQQRGILRQRHSLPLVDRLEAWIDAMEPKCIPSSKLASAITYARQQRPYIRRVFEQGRFEIDNGHTERTLREPCLGRKNFLFTGSNDAAARLADSYSLVQSCAHLGIPTDRYLIDVINKLEAGWPQNRIHELVPDVWMNLHGPGAAHETAQ